VICILSKVASSGYIEPVFLSSFSPPSFPVARSIDLALDFFSRLPFFSLLLRISRSLEAGFT